MGCNSPHKGRTKEKNTITVVYLKIRITMKSQTNYKLSVFVLRVNVSHVEFVDAGLG